MIITIIKIKKILISLGGNLGGGELYEESRYSKA